MIVLPDDPAIRHIEDRGYPQYIPEEEPCPLCGEALGELRFEVDNELICVHCFHDWVLSYLRTNPEQLAEALSVDVCRII